MQSCGEAIVRYLEKKSVSTVFGIPGVHNLELYRGLQGSSIRHILCRHEQGAGFLADGYARASGEVGVAFVITGPGLTNISTAIGQAYADSIPMLVISSVNESWSLGKGTGRLHECERQLSVTDSITGFNARVHSVDEAYDALDRAFTLFESERPRPVHIEVPIDVLAQTVPEGFYREPAAITAQRPSPSSEELLAALELLSKAEKPMIIVGGGAIEAADAVAKLAEKLRAPTFTTVAGKGMLPIGHPFKAGATLCTEAGWNAIEQADVVLAIGTEMADTDFWRDTLPITGSLIRVDIDERKLTDLYPAKLAIHSDANAFVASLLTYENLSSASVIDEEFAIELRNNVRENLLQWDQSLVRILDAIMKIATDTRVVADMTQLAYAANFTQPIDGARRWLHPTGFGTLGYALPAAIGAALADPSTPVLAIAGDGGLQYTVQELATAKEIASPMVLLIWNNSRLGQIWDDMERTGIEPIAVAMDNPDFGLLARAYDIGYSKPGTLAALKASLSGGLSSNGLTIIEVTPSILDR